MKSGFRSGLLLSAVAASVVVACGGSGDIAVSDGDSGGSDTLSTSNFPTGVSLASPTSLSSSSNVVAYAAPSNATQLADWGRAMWAALQAGDGHQVAQLATKLLPLGTAWASTDKVPEGKVVSSEIEAFAKGTLAFSHTGLFDLNDLFSSGATNASCFGPQVSYANHDFDNSSGNLPSGDLGLWTADNTDSNGTQPCAAAQLNQRLSSVKKQVRQAMLLMAGLRRVIAASSGALEMPTAGNTTTVSTELATALTSVLAGVSIDAASVALDGGGNEYTYRLVISAGSGISAKSSEIVIKHTPGSGDTVFTGMMQITAAKLDNDPAFACTDQVDVGTSRNKVATVTTISYSRNGSALQFGARSGNYCGGPSSIGSASHIADVAALDTDELDPTAHATGSDSSQHGWRGNFSRFSGDVDIDTQAGNFVYIWQAGIGDSNGRAFVVNSAYNSGSETRTLKAYYGYTADIGTTDSSLLGMICNWAGPGNSHTPSMAFQSQALTLGPSATAWSRTASLITYAPTTSCNSGSGMTYDADGDTSIGTGEGSSVTNTLDGLTGVNSTVQDEIDSRGFTTPSLF